MKNLFEEKDDITNVYRTTDYIVKQTVILREDDMGVYLFSRDTFIYRTTQRDREYEDAFGFRSNMDGLRSIDQKRAGTFLISRRKSCGIAR